MVRVDVHTRVYVVGTNNVSLVGEIMRLKYVHRNPHTHALLEEEEIVFEGVKGEIEE